MIFLLGTHHADWLGHAGVPLFVNRATLAKRKSFPKAIAPWALDSRGFTELSKHGRWTIEPEQYAEEARLFSTEIGRMEWAAPQDWMCEKDILVMTGLTVAEHQRRTIANFLRLRELAPEIPWTPVLQGWTMGNYLDHVRDYRAAGVALESLPLVGLGSVCRRQDTTRIMLLLEMLVGEGLTRMHGFGFKTGGLKALEMIRATSGEPHLLTSADSLAWSLNARKNTKAGDRITDCTHRSCANCLKFALEWRARLLERLGREGGSS